MRPITQTVKPDCLLAQLDIGLKLTTDPVKGADLASRLIDLAAKEGFRLAASPTDDGVVIATNAEAADAFAGNGKLGKSENFKRAVAHPGAFPAFYMDIDSILEALKASNPPPDPRQLIGIFVTGPSRRTGGGHRAAVSCWGMAPKELSTVTTSTTTTGPVRWLFAPATEHSTRGSEVSMAALRITVGLLWLYNVSWKRPPDFGRDSGKGLYGFTKDAVDHPVFAPYSWVVDHVVLPNFTAFGWTVLVVETALAVLLLTGAWVRLAALVGIGQSVAIGLSVAQTPGEWPWSYWMLIGIHVVLLFGAAGAVLAVDAVRASDQPHRRVRFLALVWGTVAVVAGIVAVLMSLGDDALAASGATLGGPGLSISLGSYNLVGAIALIVIGVLTYAAAQLGNTLLARVAAVLGVVCAVSLYAQLGWTDPWLGGSNTSAGFFLVTALIAATVAHSAHRHASDTPVVAHA